ncbi:MAG TPA: DUF2961 domain-containing protein [Clostridia bacterium]|nr:DUF2961 domain-containing protein [Clostridia bacterium]
MKFHNNCRERKAQLSMEASGRLRYQARGYLGGSGRMTQDRAVVEPGRSERLFAAQGAGYISSLGCTLPGRYDDALLRIYAGRAEPDIELPVRSLFLSGEEGKATQGAYAGKRYSQGLDQAHFWRQLFIPFADGCRIELVNCGQAAYEAALHVEWVRGERPQGFGIHGRAMACRAAGRSREMAEAVTIADIRGRGALHSMQMSLKNPDSPGSYMEGNLEIFIDGNPFPEYQSTGTEEFFMGGVYFTNLHNSAYSGCTRTFNDGSENPSHLVSAFRLFVEDEITFERSLKIVWHNGQPRQWNVVGPTSYDFSCTYYLDDNPDAAPLAASHAHELLDALDGNRAALPLRSAAWEAEEEIELQGPGALESLYLCLAGEKAAGIRLSIDGNGEQVVPLHDFFQTEPGYPETHAQGGHTGRGVYYRLCDMPFAQSLHLRVTGVKGNAYAEYRAGSRAVVYETRHRMLAAGGRHLDNAYVSLAEETESGVLDALVYRGADPADTRLVLTGMQEEPLALIRLADPLRGDGCGMHRRSFAESPFPFEAGLKMRLFADKAEGTMTVSYRVRRPANAATPPLSALLQRLNRLDLGASAYETRCYNAVEGSDGKIPAGQTRVMLEDFGAGLIKCFRFGSPPVGAALHEAALRVYLDGESMPAIDTTCARFFSADYCDPIFWSNTRKLSRLSKRGGERPKNDGQHSSFFRYVAIPYRKGVRVTLTAPEDSPINGFDNVYFASARAAGVDFGCMERLRCASTREELAPGASLELARTGDEARVVSIQLQLEGDDSAFLHARLEALDGQSRTLLSAPLYQYFFGAPPEDAGPGVLGEYSPLWRDKLGEDEGYYSAPTVGWVRRGGAPRYRQLLYRLLEDRPVLLPPGGMLRLTNGTNTALRLEADVLLAGGKED